jgi:hypothetical protein
MEEAVDEKMNTKDLIRYFARMLFHQPPSCSKDMFDTFLDDLNPPKFDGKTKEHSRKSRTQTVLNQLEYIFRQLGTDCK